MLAFWGSISCFREPRQQSIFQHTLPAFVNLTSLMFAMQNSSGVGCWAGFRFQKKLIFSSQKQRQQNLCGLCSITCTNRIRKKLVPRKRIVKSHILKNICRIAAVHPKSHYTRCEKLPLISWKLHIICSDFSPSECCSSRIKIWVRIMNFVIFEQF